MLSPAHSRRPCISPRRHPRLALLLTLALAACTGVVGGLTGDGRPTGLVPDAGDADPEARDGGSDAGDAGPDVLDAGTDAGADAGLPALQLYLLAGQSNMEGNVDRTLFDQLMYELEHGVDADREARLKGHLTDWYLISNNGYASYGYSEAIAALETSELLRLHAAGLVGSGLNAPLASILCARGSADVASLGFTCGNPYGPELLLGHVLDAADAGPTSLIKVAQGGTTLFADWRSPASGGTTGPLYLQLQARIAQLATDPARLHPACATRPCRWAAFVWFQGENDSFDQAGAQAYAENLKNLLADVRREVGDPRLPVVILQVGRWAQSLPHGPQVAAAQRAVVDGDPLATLIATDDLSGFYHYDPAAQLIIGERLGRVALRLR